MTERLKILFLAAEAAPFIKIGGLGDVAGTLPAALQALPEAPQVRLVIPLHPAIDQSAFPLEKAARLSIAHQDGSIQAEVFRTIQDGVEIFLIDGQPFQEETGVYSPDTLVDGHKYAFFSLAALALVKSLDWKPDILHAQDWHTAPAVHALKTILRDDPFFEGTGTLLTVHNLPYLGENAGPALTAFGLPAASPDCGLPKWALNMPLPLGLLAADKINTVSPGYAAEMLTKQYGTGLQRFLQYRQDDLVGILNGLNLERWDPSTDSQLRFTYDSETLETRKKNKHELLKELGLHENQTELPLIAYIGRMEGQKGVDVAIKGLRRVRRLPWQAVLLGAGVPEIEAQAVSLATQLPGKLSTVIRYDEGLARRIYAGADMILVPSRYEPCGLIQMIAMRYGCIPVATATGGLRDTIIDQSKPGGTGFLFNSASPRQMDAALKRALTVFKDKDSWLTLQQHGMAQNFSWEKSAREYYEVYQSIQKMSTN
jgi:starch synthase